MNFKPVDIMFLTLIGVFAVTNNRAALDIAGIVAIVGMLQNLFLWLKAKRKKTDV